MRRQGEVRGLYTTGKLPKLDQRHHAKTGPEGDPEPLRTKVSNLDQTWIIPLSPEGFKLDQIQIITSLGGVP